MFYGKHAGDQSQNLGRSTLGLQDNFFVGDELLRGSRHRTFSSDGDLRDFQFRLVRIVRKNDCARAEGESCHQKKDRISPVFHHDGLVSGND